MRCFELALLICLLGAGAGGAQEPLTVVSWGGAYERAQRAAVFAPFTRATGIPVRVARYDGDRATLKRRAATEGWDVIDMLEPAAISACEAGLLRRLDYGAILDDPRAARADFAPARLRPCSLPQNVFATVMAYDDRAFPGVKPTGIADFFDVARFPGKRAIRKSPDNILEWALLAEGVPPAQVYDLLSTDRGLRLAFRKLDQIRDHILWWTDPAEPAQMLADGRAAMAAGFNGRFFDAAQQDGAPIAIVWDGRIIGVEGWAIAAATDAPEAARAFVARAVTPEAMARLSERIPYGPARVSAFA